MVGISFLSAIFQEEIIGLIEFIQWKLENFQKLTAINCAENIVAGTDHD